ncbi:hypothetical protein EDC96DRAFT_569689 [Choanephora cucurbitarum]|nr:hypothetical protein EDC96DRAFT_569689 [Choanephora cucurbitarum]
MPPYVTTVLLDILELLFMYARLLPNLGLLGAIDVALTCLKRLKQLITYYIIYINKNALIFFGRFGSSLTMDLSRRNRIKDNELRKVAYALSGPKYYLDAVKPNCLTAFISSLRSIPNRLNTQLFNYLLAMLIILRGHKTAWLKSLLHLLDLDPSNSIILVTCLQSLFTL